jgi:predicted amidohydrolase YtcJ
MHTSSNRLSVYQCAAICLAAGALLCATGAEGAPSDLADQIFIGGAVYTQDAAQPWAEGFALRDGKYFAVGSTAAMRELAGPTTRIVDLKGRMVMSGLVDDHVHAVDGAMGELYDCLFPSTATPSRIRRILTECVKKTPQGTWISGGYWASDFFKHYPTASPRKWLDEIGGERPIILRDDTGHNVWANSAALRLAGVASDAADPTGGRFERDGKTNSPNGIALEAAAEKIQAAVSERTTDQYLQSALRAQKIAHHFGIIGLKEADASTPTIAAYQAADKQGRLSLYVATCISTLAMQVRPDSVLNFDEIDKVRAAYHSNLVATDFVKIYLDGVPTAARTAAMLEPYLPNAEGKRVSGDLHVNPDVLANDVVELDRRGYTIKMHAAGDRAIREGLDAIAAARRANPHGQLRHELAHAGYIAPQDIGRFAELNAVAEFSPVIWYPSPIIDAVIEVVGERAKHYWPMRTLVASHAPLAAGSDWPSVVPSMDPWGGIQAMVTRSDPYHKSTQTLWPEEAIGLADALRIYTLGGAAALRREAQTGSIVVGKSADFIVLDRNLFKIPTSQINAARVQMTFFQGRMVYQHAAPHNSRDGMNLVDAKPAIDGSYPRAYSQLTRP